MKRYLLILASVAMLFACKQEEDPDNGNGNGNGNGGGQDKVELSLSAEKMVFSSFGGEQAVEVTTNQTSWKADVADECKDWLSVTTSGNTVIVTAAENATADELTGLVAVSAGDKIVTLTVTQDGAEPNATDNEGTTISYTLAEGTTIAPKGMAQYITSLKKDQRYFILSKDTPEGLMPIKGQKLIINTATRVLPEGLLARIHTIEETEDGYKVGYDPLQLGDVFQSLDLRSEGLTGEVVEAVDDGGNPIEYTSSITKAPNDNRFHIELPSVQWHLPANVHVTPKLKADIGMKLALQMDDNKVSVFNCLLDANVDFGADLELAFEDKLFNAPHRIATLYLGGIMVGPVLFTPTVDLYVILNVGGKMSLTAKVGEKIHGTGRIFWNDVDGGQEPHFDIDEPEYTQFYFKPGTSVATTLSIGGAIGFGLGVYGEIINTSIRLNAYNDFELSTALDFDTWSTMNPKNWFDAGLKEAQISSAFKFDVDLACRILDKEVGSIEAIATYENKYFERKFFPTVNENLTCLQEGSNTFTVSTTVDAPSVFSGSSESRFGQLILLYHQSDNPDAEWKYAPFNMTEEKAEALRKNPDKKQPVEAKLEGLEPGHNYSGIIGWKFGDGLLPIGGTQIDIQAIRGDAYRAVFDILKDLRACASGEWAGCNWDEEGVNISQLKNVWLGVNLDDLFVYICK